MKVHIRELRMFVRAPVEDMAVTCIGCAGYRDASLCAELPRCTGDKASIFKEVVYKEKQDA